MARTRFYPHPVAIRTNKNLALAFCFLGVVMLAAYSSLLRAQTSPPGRIAFDRSGCATCHAYLSRRSGPPIRGMLTKYQGDPEAALSAIHGIAKHDPLLLTGKITEQDLELMAGWLSDSVGEKIDRRAGETASAGTRRNDIRLTHPGRIAFDFKGCRDCHGYSSRRGATMVREMLNKFEDDAEGALERIREVPQHRPGVKSGTVSAADQQAIAAWMAALPYLRPGETQAPSAVATAKPPVVARTPEPLPERVARPASASDAGVPAASLAPAPIVITEKDIATPAPLPPAIVPVVPPIAASATGKAAEPSTSVVRMNVQAGTQSDRLVLMLSGKEPEGMDIRSVDGNLVVRLPGFALAPGVPRTLAVPADARAVDEVRIGEEGGGLVLTVLARSGNLKHDAIQGRNRITINISSIPSQRPPPPVMAPPAASVVQVPVAPPAPVVPPLALARPKAETAPAPVGPDPSAKARRDAEERARREAEQKARREAEVKRENEARTAKTKPDDKAKVDADEAARKEIELLAALRASAEALKGGGAEGAPSGRRDRSKLKRPEKFRDEPCPPLSESEPIGRVDEKIAKDIMERVGCTQCHAHVQVKTGPPLKRVFEKVRGNPSCVIKSLKGNKEHKEEGVTDDIKGPEFKILADYYATRAK